MKISSHLTAQIRTVLSRLMSYFSKHVIVTDDERSCAQIILRSWCMIGKIVVVLFRLCPTPFELGRRFSSSLRQKRFFLPARNVFTYVPLIFTLHYKLHLQLGITLDFSLEPYHAYLKNTLLGKS